MEKDYRLFLRNLPPDIDDSILKNLLNKHGEVAKIDIKEKIQNDGSKIAFVNLTTTDRRLNTCFQAVNGVVVNGYELSIQVAKESFLDRLKREREEAAKREAANKEPKKISRDQPIERINIKAPAALRNKSTKRIYDFDEFEKPKSNGECAEEINDTGNCFSKDPALEIETVPPEKHNKIAIKVPQKLELNVAELPEKKVLNESEIKRLASLKQKRQAFKAKELMISHALKSVDSSRRNNKVIFSDNTEDIGKESKIKSKSLFDDDEDEEYEAEWNDNKFQHDENRAKQLAMSLNNLGRDKRFILDERFLDDEETNSKTKDDEKYDENDLQNEKKWQMDILQNVLGKPLTVKDERVANTRKKMVRYDPTEKSHRAHELEITQKVSTKAGKRKRATNEQETEEETPVPVSSDVFYSVSENLTESLKVQGEFSLLKTFGTATTADKNKSDDYAVTANTAKQQKYQHNFDGKDPFKYESSDEEDGEPSMDQINQNNDSSAKINNKPLKRNDDFFFDTKDQRFSEAEEFFKTQPSITQEFKNVRRELKQIVRSKIRNNVKRNTPWRNKKIGTKTKAQ